MERSENGSKMSLNEERNGMREQMLNEGEAENFMRGGEMFQMAGQETCQGMVLKF